MVKYADNAWHALKVGVRQRDRQRLQGPRHRQPPGDGHLLPGHQAQPLALLPEAGLRLRRLVPAQGRARPAYQARLLDVKVPLIVSILPSNQRADRARAPQPCMDKGSKQASACSASASRPAPTTCARARWWSWSSASSARATTSASTTSNVSLASIHGANRDYILNHIPHISSMMVDTIDEVLEHADDRSSSATGSPEFREVPERAAAEHQRSSTWCASARTTSVAERLRRRSAGDASRASASSSSSRTCPSPFDRRVWQEASALRDAGYAVSDHLPDRQGLREPLRG